MRAARVAQRVVWTQVILNRPRGRAAQLTAIQLEVEEPLARLVVALGRRALPMRTWQGPEVGEAVPTAAGPVGLAALGGRPVVEAGAEPVARQLVGQVELEDAVRSECGNGNVRVDSYAVAG